MSSDTLLRRNSISCLAKAIASSWTDGFFGELPQSSLLTTLVIMESPRSTGSTSRPRRGCSMPAYGCAHPPRARLASSLRARWRARRSGVPHCWAVLRGHSGQLGRHPGPSSSHKQRALAKAVERLTSPSGLPIGNSCHPDRPGSLSIRRPFHTVP